MSSAVQADLSEPTTTLAWITRQAEGQVGQLCPLDQAKIAQALACPLRRNRCGIVDNLAQYRVFHFRASKTLRVSYRPTERGLCVIHVGKHSEFDRFARHFTGQSPNNLIPLQESQIMKNQQHVGKNGTTKAISTQANVEQPRQAMDGEEQLLVESLREIIGKAVGPRHDALESDWTARLDAMHKNLEQTTQECTRKIVQQESRLNGLAGEYRGKLADLSRTTEEIGSRQQDLATTVAQTRSDFDDRLMAQSHVLEEVRAEVARQAVQANVARSETDLHVTALNSQMEQRAQEIGVRIDALADIMESRQASSETRVTGVVGQVSSLEQTLASVDQALRGLAATVQAQQQTISRLQEDLFRVSTQVAELTAPEVKRGLWQRTLDRARQFGWRWTRTAFRHH